MMPTPLHGLPYAGLDVGVGDDFERLQQSGDLGRVDVIIDSMRPAVVIGRLTPITSSSGRMVVSSA